MEYILEDNESYRDFIHRALQGKTSEDNLQLFVVLLEMVIPEINLSTYTISCSCEAAEISLTIHHSGKAIKKNMINIIDDQVDYLLYQHASKDSHILKLKKSTRIND